MITTYSPPPVFPLDAIECPICTKNLYSNQRRGRYLGRIAHWECATLKRIDDMEVEQERMGEILEQARRRLADIAYRTSP